MTAYIMVGPSGSGKSTWIKNNLSEEIRVCSADHYFMDNGEYKFDFRKLGEAHGECLRSFIQGCAAGLDVVCDNTNTTIEDIAPYMAVAAAYSQQVEVVLFNVPPEVCAERNSHGVPFSAIDRMFYNIVVMRDKWPRRWPKPKVIKEQANDD